VTAGEVIDDANPHAPEDAEALEWDVAVIGTGMGGATSGLELARLGYRVLFIEKGLYLHGASSADADRARPGGWSESPSERLRAGHWPLRLHGRTSFGEIEFFAPLGCGAGGSTMLYAAGLERFAPSDFRPRSNFPDIADSTLPEEWPVGYDELRPFYERAEALYRVRGTPDPLERGGEPVLLPPPPLSERDQHLLASFQRLGLHPYRVHVGCEFVDGCTGCAAGPCAYACKSDAGRICLTPALEKFGARLLSQCEALALEADERRALGIRCRWKGKNLLVRSKIIVLAAGAYMTPALLLKSRSEHWPSGLANRSGLVGRNLMFHVSDYFAVAPLRRLPSDGPQKSLALNDFYHSAGEKLGTFQAVGGALELGQIMQYIRDAAERERTWWKKLAGPRPLWWRKVSSPVVRLAALALSRLLNYGSAAVWANIVEDLPYHDNRIIADSQASNGMRFEYRYPEELRRRVQSFRRRLAEALRPHRVLVLTGENNLNFGHVCGTCRFGRNPETSVLNKDNRAHDLANLYIVDASFFPSSGGTNPGLTIAANALRVAATIRGDLG
jgi:choline dehydrogenase-like flavoprotein